MLYNYKSKIKPYEDINIFTRDKIIHKFNIDYIDILCYYLFYNYNNIFNIFTNYYIVFIKN
jgi:hypothetical protein